MLCMIEYLFILGMIIVIGFLATIIFERTKISTVLILMLLGFILGPMLGFVDASDETVISQISPFMAMLALVILLFDGGMMLDIKSVVKAVPKSTAFTFLVFVATVILVTLFCVLIGWDPLQGALIGAIIGGTSSAVVIAMAERAGITREAKAFLTIESTITDALCIIGAVVVVEIIVTASIVAEDISHTFLAAFLLALFTGGLAALVWMFIIEKLRIDQYYYMLTLAVALIVFSATEWIGASGGFAVFIFGLVLGNAKSIVRMFAASYELAVDQTMTMKVFQKEITFFVRTFFFVYAGLLLLPQYFTWDVIGIGLMITILALLGRGIAGKIIIRGGNGDSFTGQDRQIIFTTMPRGLAAAVLATTPSVVAVTTVGFSPIVFGVIIFSNVIATLGIFFLSGERPLGPSILKRVKTTWEKLNAPEEELKKIEKKEKKEQEKNEKKKEEEAKKEVKKEIKEEKKKEVKQIKNEVKKEEKDLKKLEKKIEKVKEEKEQKPL